jgi:hypothetical protein
MTTIDLDAHLEEIQQKLEALSQCAAAPERANHPTRQAHAIKHVTIGKRNMLGEEDTNGKAFCA